MGTSSQRGYVTPRGKKWYGYFRKTVNDPTTAEQKTVGVTVILGPRSQMKRSEAREALERKITQLNGQTSSPNKRDRQNSVELGTPPKGAFPFGSSGPGPLGTRHDECPPSQRTVRAQMEMLQPGRIQHERERNRLHGQDPPVGQNP